jgi:hypothetical protein
MTTVSAAAPATTRAQRPSILSPTLDLLCVGGLSIIVLVPLLLTGRSDLLLIGPGAQAWIATLINMPHFMASYRMVYRDRDMILRHKWASIYIPLLLFLYAVVALWQAQYSPDLVTLLVVVSSGYLAWHYTGQVWGMMASYAHLAGNRFDEQERWLIRGSLRILLVWHLTWFVYHNVVAYDFGVAYQAMNVATLVAFGLGAVGLFRMRRRTGRFPPLRALVAWGAIFVWYAALARDPKALFWVQIAHALQYLEFPVRVEINRSVRAAAGRVARHMVVYAVVLLGISYLLGMIVPRTAMDVIGATLGERPGQVAPVLILSFINIHHYFTDGVIWKISNPAVRRELFAHVTPPASPGEKAASSPPDRKQRKGNRR